MLFKSVNHFSHTAYSINPLLNDVVDHRRNPATITGFRQARLVPESVNLCRNPETSGHRRRIPTKLARIRHKWPDSGHFRRNLTNPNFGLHR
jgi:hypothetical protein